MKVKCTGSKHSYFTRLAPNKIYEISDSGEIVVEGGYSLKYGSALRAFEYFKGFYNIEILPEADRYELHITCNDGKTTNAVYKVNGKIEKRTEAVCAPSDTFNFNVGAELAINRVLYGTDYNPKDVAFKPTQPIAPQEDEPKENDTLYCIKSDDGWCKFEKGNTYECNGLSIREGTRSTTYIKNSDWWFKSHFVKLVKRPAKVGEWILLIEPYNWQLDRYGAKKNGVYQVKELYGSGNEFVSVNAGQSDFAVNLSTNYLVLDNYHPEPEKEPEPVYWTGAVKCEKWQGKYFKEGDVYAINNGNITDDCGNKYEHITSFEDFDNRVSGKFIPYLGEA